MMNNLSKENSPYLLQHAENPVDWYPWGPEAFKKAKSEDKPVFLSIGYATCHWCHVMAHESFEDEDVANLMNDAFVNIKVDREERPDIDHTYMTICQMLTGHGGWPLNLIMTPDKEPFFAATYIPKQGRHNRAGMMQLIPQIKKIWTQDRELIHQNTEKIKTGFQKSLELGSSKNKIQSSSIETARKELAQRFDPVRGGFGQAPKFPSPHNLILLLNIASQENDEKALQMATLTLEKMRLGGLWDHIGFGFHRYSTDHKWLLPHFEKMLYDQATLLMAFSLAYSITGNQLFKQTGHQILDYIDNKLTAKSGAFYSAEDADSEGEEGKFYIWHKQEIEKILSDHDATLFSNLLNIKSSGNFQDEATGQKTGANIPHMDNSLPVSAKSTEMTPQELESWFEKVRTVLYTEREKREYPLLDDKMLTDWNGLMIAALAQSGIRYHNSIFIKKAEKAWDTISGYCLKDNGALCHRVRDGEVAIEGMADDYTFTVLGLIELYKSTLKPVYLRQALLIQHYFDEHFLDEEHGGYFFTAKDAEPLLGRQKEMYDGAMPSSNSTAALNGFYLTALTGEPRWQDHSYKILSSFSDMIQDQPVGYTFALNALYLMENSHTEIIICKESTDDEALRVIEACRNLAPEGTIIHFKTEENQSDLNELVPLLRNYPIDKKLTIYICENFTCQKPVHSLEEVEELMS